MLKRIIAGYCKSVNKQINLVFFLGTQSIALFVGISFYIQYSSYMMKSVEHKIADGIYAVENIIEANDILTLDEKSNLTEEYFAKWQKIKNIQEKFNLAYVYVLLYEKNQKFRFTYESGDDPRVVATPIKEDSFNFTYSTHVEENQRKGEPSGLQKVADTYFLIYDDAPKEALKAFETEKLVFADEFQDKYGNFRSGFYPLKQDGKIVGVIGVDCDISEIVLLRRGAVKTLLFILLAGLLFSFLVRYLIRRLVVIPIITLNDGARQIAEGNLSVNIKLDKQNELGQLAISFNQMSSNLKKSFDQIKEYNEQLEEKVAIRTNELQETLTSVQKLKMQQDGDYFLTSLLTNPLMQNRSKSKSVFIEFLLDQKKKFQFKNKEHHIGGDLCISGDLLFNRTSHTFFFNGDAMGKSMQGAGGALVMGSMINSILARSASRGKVISISVKDWLAETFTEIQRVMEAFDGTMLVSCVIGVINNDTGVMNYINAEHPFVILYRDNIAQFIEDSISAHKIGMPENDMEIREFVLLKGDMLFCGSDGKDDLVLSKEDGVRVINEDETLFLRVLEEVEGDLQRISAILQNYGELSDDFSIVKIEFIGKEAETRTEEKYPDLTNQCEIIVENIRKKNYLQAMKIIEKSNQSDALVKYYRALCLSRLGKHRESLDELNALDQEFKEQKQVLKLLAKVYRDLGMLEEAANYERRFAVLN